MPGYGLALINFYEFLHPLYIYFQDESWVVSEISEIDKKIYRKNSIWDKSDFVVKQQ